MEIYKIVAFVPSLISVPLALLLAKSISLGQTHKINSILGLAIIPTILWFFFISISLFEWWGLLVIPICWLGFLIFIKSFISYLADSEETAGIGLLIGQTGYAFFTSTLLTLSLISYFIGWIFFS